MNKEDEVKARVTIALEALYINDALLLEYNANERTIAAKLARHLEGVFPSHHVDVEYNRHGLEPKAVGLPEDCHNGGDRLVIPDVVVHRRGIDTENVLVIEIKKTTNSESRDCDRAKVRAIKRQLGYEYGLVIDLPAGPGAPSREPSLEWI